MVLVATGIGVGGNTAGLARFRVRDKDKLIDTDSIF